ncbi:hypothetical protein EDB19DRAFT_1737512 [Suillus lakei]|nr:hypothetical protein EDB19DRAFT_1737512 [Suillus lakei]
MHHVLLQLNVASIHFSISSAQCVATCTLFSGWGSYAYITNVKNSADIVFTAAVAVFLAVRFATNWMSLCSDRHYRCCQRNNNGEEGETHRLFEEV